MAQPTAEEASLLGIPIEIRHMIFEYASIRDTKPKKVLRYWFEKTEVKEIIAKQVADNPDGVTPQPSYYNDEYEQDSEEEIAQDNEEDDEDEQDDEDEENEQDDGQDDEDEDEEEDDAIADDDGQQEEAEADNEDENMVDGEDGVAVAAQDEAAEADTVMDNGENVSAEAHEGAQGESSEGIHNGDEEVADADQNSEVDADEATDNGGNVQTEGDQDAEGDADEDMVDEDANAVTSATNTGQTAPPPPPPPAPVVRPHRKWRHIPKFLRMTQCPPPVELFLINKQLNSEAKDWFYKVAVLKIDATASFQHVSFFETALGQIAEAAFSPMENIKKAEVSFVWDSTWVRAEPSGFATAVFPALLDGRAAYVLKILQQAPELEQVVIHWHDSAEDDEAITLMANTLEQFVLNLRAEVKTETHYIASDAKPHAKSIAGKRRIEFQNILDSGCETF